MANFTAGLVENLALVITKTSQSIEELKAMITSQNIVIEFLNNTIDSLKANYEFRRQQCFFACLVRKVKTSLF